MRDFIAVCMALFVASLPVAAQTATWTGASNTDYYNNANWLGNTLPQSGGTILFSPSASNFTLNLFGLSSNGIDTIRFDNAGLGSFTMQNGSIGLQGSNLVEVTSLVPTPQTINMNLNLSGAGAFRNNGGGMLTIGGNVSLNGQFSVDGSNTVHISGNITGSGNLVKSNGSLLILSGSSSFNTTTVSAGTLQIGNGGTSGSFVGSIQNNSAVAFNRSDSSSYLATLFGTGSVTKSGAGALTLGSGNAYSGATIINGGILNVSSLADGGVGSSIGVASTDAGNLVLNGGTLRNNTGSGQTTNRLFTLGAGGGTLDAGASRFSFDGVGSVAMSGTGTRTLTLTGDNAAENSGLDLHITDASPGAVSLVKSGVNTWVIFGNHTHSGPTTIQAGLLNLRTPGSPNSTYSVSASARLELASDSGTATLGSLAGSGTVAGGILTGTVTAAIGSNGASTNFSGTLENFASGSNLALNKVGGGTLTLTGTNTYTGGTIISGGSLELGNGGTTGSVPGSILNNANLRFNRSDNITVNASITGVGSLTKIGGGNLTLASAFNTLAGSTSVNEGTLTINTAGGLNTGGVHVAEFTGTTATVTVNGVLNGGSFITVGDNAIGTGVGGTGTLTINNGGNVSMNPGAKLTVGWINAVGFLNLNAGGLLELGGTDGLQKHATGAAIFNFAGGTIKVVNSNLITNVSMIVSGTTSTINTNGLSAAFSGDTSGGGTVTKTGNGTLSVLGNWQHTGGTTVSTGTLQIGNGGTTGTVAGNITNNANVTFNRSNASSHAGDISGSGSVTKNGAGTLTVLGNWFHLGGTTVNAGVLQIGNGGTDGFVVNNIVNDANVTFNRADNILYDGAISGTGGVTKNGSGQLRLTGNHNYHGATNVNAGTLNVTGSLSSDTSVLVGSSGRLSGNGIIAGNVFSDGTIAPGTSIGTLTVGHTTIYFDSTYHLEYKSSATSPVAGTDNDLLLGLAGSTLDCVTGSGNPMNLVISAVFTGAPVGTPVSYEFARFSSITIPPGPGPVSNNFVFSGDFNGSPTVTLVDGPTFDSLVVTFTPVPEPGLLLLAGLVPMAMWTRRMRVSTKNNHRAS